MKLENLDTASRLRDALNQHKAAISSIDAEIAKGIEGIDQCTFIINDTRFFFQSDRKRILEYLKSLLETQKKEIETEVKAL